MVTTTRNLKKRNQNGVFSSVWVFLLAGLLCVSQLPVSVHAGRCVPCPRACTCSEVVPGASTCKVDCANKSLQGFPDSVEMPQPPANVTELDIKENKIQTIAKDAFSSLTSLIKLDASNNYIVDIDNIFHYLTNLEELNLLGNSISNLSPSAFAGLSKLKVLRLTRNSLVNVEKGVFDDLISLEILSLNVMKLEVVDDDLFSYCPLKELYINKNELQSIPPNLFKGLQYLQRLDISGNKISTLPIAAFIDLQSLKTIFLHTNPWNCSCDLIWLTLWLQQWSPLPGENPGALCHQPEEYIKQPVTNIQQINCPEIFSSCGRDMAGELKRVTFSEASYQENEIKCKQHCFNIGSHYGKFASSRICLCGYEMNYTCADSCDPLPRDYSSLCSRLYLPQTFGVTAGISLEPLGQLSTRVSSSFSVSSSLNIDYYIWNFGESKDFTYSTNSSRVNFSYFYPGDYSLTVTAVSQQGTNSAEVPVKVRDEVPGAELKCQSSVDVTQSLDASVLVKSGFDARLLWGREDPNGVLEKDLSCPLQWSPHRGRCVQAGSMRVNYGDAELACDSLGASLITLDYEEEMSEIIQLFNISATPDSGYLLGAQRRGISANYVWSPTQKPAFITTADVIGHTAGDCVVLYNHTLSGVDCDNPNRYICQTDPDNCIHGGSKGVDGFCYHVSQSQKTWDDARRECETLPFGDLAVVNSNNLHRLVSYAVMKRSGIAVAWIGLSDQDLEGYFSWVNAESVDDEAPEWSSQHSGVDNPLLRDCVVLEQNGVAYTWIEMDCSEEHHFICRYENEGDDINVPSYAVGTSVFKGELLPASQLAPVATATHPTETELYILPGLWFSDGGFLESWDFIITPINTSVTLALLILRPTCPNGSYLIQPGCQGYPSPFSSCASMSYNCSLRKDCPDKTQFCHLTSDCIGRLKPCTCHALPSGTPGCGGSSLIRRGKRSIEDYLQPIGDDSAFYEDSQTDESGSSARTKRSIGQLNFLGSAPKYQVVGTIQVNLPSSPKTRYQVVDQELPVRDSDVLAFQVDSQVHYNLLCNADKTSEWRQTAFYWPTSDWLTLGNLVSLPANHSRIDDVVCLLRAKFSPSATSVVPSSLSYFSSKGPYQYSVDISGGIQDKRLTCHISAEERVAGLHLIHPPIVAPGTTQGSIGTVAMELRVETNFVLKISGGSLQQAYWDHNTNVAGKFTAACPTALTTLSHCRTNDTTAEKPFSLLKLTLDTNSALASLTVHVRNNISSQTLTVDLSKALRIIGLKIEFTKNQITATGSQGEVFVPSGESVHFRATFQEGSKFTYKWSVDGTDVPTPNNKHNKFGYSFSSPGIYTIKAHASNILGEDIDQINVTAVRAARFRNQRFDIFADVVERDVTSNLTVDAGVNPGTRVRVGIEFGDNQDQTESVLTDTSSLSLPFSHRYSETGRYLVNVTLSDVFQVVFVFRNVTVVNKISSVQVTVQDDDIISLSSKAVFHIVVGGVDLGDVMHSWNFGDGTSANYSGINTVIHRRFSSSGMYTVSVQVSNGISTMSGSTHMRVEEEISGLLLTYDGPKSSESAVTFTLSLSTGSDVEYLVDLGDGHPTFKLSVLTFTHRYVTPGVYNVTVMAQNYLSRSLAHLTVYALGPEMLEVIRIDTPPCKGIGELVSFTVEVVNAAPIELYYIWNFGDNSTFENFHAPNVTHSYAVAGLFSVSIEVNNTVKTETASTEMCIQEGITGLTLGNNGPLKLIRGSSVKGKVTASIKTGSDVLYTWRTGGGSPGSVQVVRCDKCTQDEYDFTFDQVGDHTIAVTASNNISEVTVDTQVTVQETIEDVQLICVDCVNMIFLATNTSAKFSAVMSKGSHMNYSWRRDSGTSVKLESNLHQEIFRVAGAYIISLTVSNDVSAMNKTLKIIVQDPVTGMALDVSSKDILVGANVTFVTQYSSGSDLNFTWNFCPSCANVTSSSGSYEYQFPLSGEYIVTVRANNVISEAFAAVTVYSLQKISRVAIATSSAGDYIPTGEVIHFTSEVEEQLKLNLSWEVEYLGSIIKTEYVAEFLFSFQKPGLYNVSLTVSNPVSTKHVEKIVNVEEKISGFGLVSNSSKIIAIDSVVRFAAEKTAGSNLVYEWRRITDTENLVLNFLSDVAIITFDNAGIENITCIVANNISEESETVPIIVQVPVASVNIEATPDAAVVTSGTQMTFHANVGSGTYLNYRWSFDYTSAEIDQTREFTYIFNAPGVFVLTLEVSNDIGQVSAQKNITVQDSVSDLAILVVRRYVKTRENVEFNISTSAGTNLQFQWTFNDGSESLISADYRIAHSFMTAGVYIIELRAVNNISSDRTQMLLSVQDPVEGLTVINCCSNVIPVNQDYNFTADTVAGTNVSFNLGLHDFAGNQLCVFNRRSMICSLPESGRFYLRVIAFNKVNRETKNYTITAQSVIENIAIEPVGQGWDYLFQNQKITFRVTGTGLGDGETFTSTWIIDGLTTIIISVPEIDWTFDEEGEYNLTVMVENEVSSSKTMSTIIVRKFLCHVPVVEIVGDGERHSVPSRSSEFEAIIDSRNCTTYAAVHLWKVFIAHSCSQPLTRVVELPSSVYIKSPVLKIPRWTLSYGSYCIQFTTGYDETSVTKSVNYTLTVQSSPLVAIISGGDNLMLPSSQPILFDGSSSYDPDVFPAKEANLAYLWHCSSTVPQGTSPSQNNCFDEDRRTVFSIEQGIFLPDLVYTITLSVSLHNRSSSVQQKIEMSQDPVPVASIECLSCRASDNNKVSSSQHVALLGKCRSCQQAESVQYMWSVFLLNGSYEHELQLNFTTTTTGANASNLVVRRGALSDDSQYLFRLNVTTTTLSGQQSFSSETSVLLQPNHVPSGGTCSVSPGVVIALETPITVTCTGWTDPDSNNEALLYSISVERTDLSSGELESYTAYHGTRNTHQLYVAQWPDSTGSSSRIAITVRVLDELGGASLPFKKEIEVQSPALQNNQTKSQYIAVVALNQLKILVKLHHPKDLLQYAIAVILELNGASVQASTTFNDMERDLRAAVRDAITMSLADISLESMVDVQQISFALDQITKYATEIQSKQCQKAIESMLEALLKLGRTCVQQGLDSADFAPRLLLSTVSNLVRAVNLPVHSPGDLEVSSGGLRTSASQKIFANINPKYFSLSGRAIQGVSPEYMTTHASDEAHRADIVTEAVQFTESIMSTTLMTQVPCERPAMLDLGTIHILGQRTLPPNIWSKQRTEGCQFQLPASLLDGIPPMEEIFQVLFVMPENPFTWGYQNNGSITSQVPSLSFLYTNGSRIPVQDLPQTSSVKILMFRSDGTENQIFNDNLMDSRQYHPQANLDMVNFTMEGGTSKKAVLDTSQGTEDSALHIQIRLMAANGTSNAEASHLTDSSVMAYLGANYEASENRYEEKKELTLDMMDAGTDHRLYTIFVESRSFDPQVTYTVTLVNTDKRVPIVVMVVIYFTSCQYFNTGTNSWDNRGCDVVDESTPNITVCSCDHLTSFGGSTLVPPGSIDFKDLLTLDLGENPIALITCCIIGALYTILAVICRRIDLKDLKRISKVPLCGKDGSYKYEITTVTGRQPGAGTSAHIGIKLYGEDGKSGSRHLSKPGAFQRNCQDTFLIAHDVNLGKLWKVLIWHDNAGRSPSWYLIQVVVRDLQTDQRCLFLANSWLSLQMDNGFIQKEIVVAGPHEVQKFSRLWKSAASRGLADQHLWLSLYDRPAQSRFTRLQRVTCCFTLIFTYMCINVMWYGVLKTTSDYQLTWGGKYLSWEEIVVGAVSSLLVFPVNILIAYIFRKTRCKDNVFEYGQKPQTAETLEIDADCPVSRGNSLRTLSLHGELTHHFDRESTTDSLVTFNRPCALRRTNTMPMFYHEETDDSLLKTVVRDSSSSGVSSEKPKATGVKPGREGKVWWSNDTILNNWPVEPEFEEGEGKKGSGGNSSETAVPVNKSLRMSGIEMKEMDSDDDWSSYLDDIEPDTRSKVDTKKKGPSLKKSCSKKIDLDEWSLDEIDDKKKWEEISAEIFNDDELPKKAENKGKQPPHESELHKSVPTNQSRNKKESVRRNSTVHQTETEHKQFNPRAEATLRRRSFSGPAGVPDQAQPVKPRKDSFDHASIEGNISFGRERTVSSITTRGGNASLRKFSIGSRRTSQVLSKRPCLLPCWCIYLAYGLCLLLTAISVLIILLYANKLGSEMTWRWIISLLLSFLLSAFITEPLKVVFLAVFVAAITKRVDEVEDDDAIEVKPMIEANEKLKDVKFKPLGGYALLQAREDGKKINRMHVLMRQFVAYFSIFWLVLVISYVNYNSNLFNFSNTIRQQFVISPANSTMSFNNIDSIGKFWQWSEDNLAMSLHSEDDLNPNLLLGPARFRQIRSVTAECPASSYFSSRSASGVNTTDCEGAGGFTQDEQSYGVGWYLAAANTSWRYYTSSQLDWHSVAGQMSWYSGGGYIQTLGTSLSDTMATLSYLQNKRWINHRTRAVFVEFAIYNPSLALTTVVTLLVEFPLTGKALPSAVIESHHLLRLLPGQVNPMLICQVILLIVAIYFVVHLILSVKGQGFSYFMGIWNWVELVTTILIPTSFSLYVACVVQTTSTFRQYFSDIHSYTNFHQAAYLNDWMRIINAWLVFFLMLKVVKQLRFLKFLSVFEKALSSACGKLFAVFILFGALLCAYAQLGYLMYGAWVRGFHTYEACLVSLVGVIRGTTDFEPLLRAHSVFSHFYFYSFAWIVYGMIVGLIVAILCDTYRLIHSQMFYKLTLDIHDYEMVEFMMKRFKLWAGITKPKAAFKTVKFAGLPSLSSHSTYSSYSSHTASQTASSSSSDYYGLDRMDSTLSAGHCSQYPLDRLPTTWENVLMKMRQLEELENQEECMSEQINGSVRDWKWQSRQKQIECEKKEAPVMNKPPPGPRARPMSDTVSRGLGKFASKLPGGRSGRLSVSPPTNSSMKKDLKKRPFSDQGARDRGSTDDSQRKPHNPSIIARIFKGGKKAW